MLFFLRCPPGRVITTLRLQANENRISGVHGTAMICTHVFNRGPSGVRSPVDVL